MRLTLLNQFFAPDISPTAQLAASLAKHRAAKGDIVTVVASRGGYVSADVDAPVSGGNDVRLIRVWSPGLGKGSLLRRCAEYGAFYSLAMWRTLTLRRQDVIVSMTTPPFIAWAAVLHKWLHGSSRVRVVLWNMDCYPDAAERAGILKVGGLPSRVMRWLNRRLFAQLDHVVCLDSAMAALLSQYSPSNAGSGRALPSTIIPNWENSAAFPNPLDPDASPASAKGLSMARDLSLDGKFVILYLGNAGYGHGFETVLDAAAQLRNDPVSFVFVGGGSRWEELVSGRAALGLQNVVLHDYVPKDQTPGVMERAHCALVTLRDSALGVMSPSKLHANLALGLPVLYVGPEGSNVDEAIRRFGCGVSIRHGDSASIVGFARRMLSRDGQHELAAMRQRARGAFESAYCDRATLPAFDQVIDGT